MKEALPLSKCFTLQPSNSLLGTVTDTQASPCNKLSVIFSLCIRVVLPSLLFSVNKRFFFYPFGQDWLNWKQDLEQSFS